MDKVPVLVAAAGADWEASALDRLARSGASAVLLKRCVDLHDLLATASTGLARVALVSAGLPGLDADSVSQLRRSGLGLVVVADGVEADAGGDRFARLGVRQVLLPGSFDLLVETLQLAGADADPLPEPEAQTERAFEQGAAGRVIAVWGPAGAPGRTTVAVGLAAEIAHRGREVFLIDADPYAGAVAQHLGVLDEVSGLLAAARMANAGRLDEALLGSLARQVGDNLRLLTGLPRADRWSEVRPQVFDGLLDLAAGLSGHVVVDTGFSIEQGPVDPFEGGSPSRNGMTIASLERADEILFVGSADPVGLSRLARGLVELHDLLPRARPRVVVNRTRATLGWGEREIRGMVEGFVTPLDVHFLPDDRAAADRALMAGQSLVDTGDSELRRALSQVVDGVLGEAATSGRGRLRGLLRHAPNNR